MGIIEKFQQDLRDGMTLESALQKYNLTFKEAVDFCPRPMSKNNIKRSPKKRRNVYKRIDSTISLKKDSYQVKKNAHGKTYWGGAYNSLEDAKQVRDFLEEHGWNPVKVNEACKKFNIQRRRK